MTRIPGRLDLCPECSAYLHCCLNCRFYEPTMANSCQEPQAEDIQDKRAGNYCEFFQPGTRESNRRRDRRTKDARKTFEDLFKF